MFLLQSRLKELLRAPTVSVQNEKYIKRLIDVIDIILQQFNSPDTEPICHAICRELWSATQYISGSTLKTVPYEIVYALKVALADWGKEDFVITTAIIDERNYYFKEADPNRVLKRFIEIDMDIELIQIAFPKLYRHRPLYNVALYHELGHFIDHHYKIITYSSLLEPYSDDKDLAKMQDYHRREYFADLVAASYTGEGYTRFLGHFSRDQMDTTTHPSIQNRLNNIEDFLNGNTNSIIDLFQRVLTLLRLPQLRIRFESPDIKPRFSNVLPYDIQNDAELHGIFVSGWEFLGDVHDGKVETWCGLESFEADRIVNDLIEKSIRNRVITEKWKNVHNNQK